MHILLDNRSNTPIYRQICAQIKAQIIGGTLRGDEPLPSIRGLAKDLRISVITTKRAYDELEREGFLYTVAGKGSFVAVKNMARLREERHKEHKEIEGHIRAAAKLAKESGISAGEIEELVKRSMEG